MFSIAVAARILKRLGNKADVVALFQMSETATKLQLPNEDLQLLDSQNVIIYSIPPQKRETFYRTQLDKFRILGLQQYEKILFLDGDIMPLCNLDPFLSSRQFQENVVIEGLREPFNGGFFLLKTGYLDEIQQIIAKREAKAAQLDYPHFDLTMGWGHNLINDPWTSELQSGTQWSFLAAFADQGLLYYYAKYHRKSVSVVHRTGAIAHYGWNGVAVTKIKPFHQTTDAFLNDDSPRIRLPGKHSQMKYPFHCFVHFSGLSKPWLKGGAPPECCRPNTQYKSAKHFWMYELSELLKEQGRTDINVRTHWKKRKKAHLPPLGFFPTYLQVVNASTNLLTPLTRVYLNDTDVS